MNWWTKLFGRRGLAPQTTSPEGTTTLDPDVATWLAAAYDTANWDERAERNAAERLRSRGADGIAAVSDAFWTYPDDYALRWSMVRCASDIGGNDATAFLTEVLDAEVGPEVSRDVHHFSSVAEESSQRMQAVRGLAPAAATGNERALSALTRALDHPITVIRYAAFVAVRDLPADIRESDALAPGLRHAEREFQGVSAADVADQPLPTERFENEGKPPPPPGDERPDDRPSTRRAPRIGGQEGDSRD